MAGAEPWMGGLIRCLQELSEELCQGRGSPSGCPVWGDLYGWGAMASLAPGSLRASPFLRATRQPPQEEMPGALQAPRVHSPPSPSSPHSRAPWTHHPVSVNDHGHDDLVLEV